MTIGNAAGMQGSPPVDADPVAQAAGEPAPAVPKPRDKTARAARPRGYVTLFGTWCKGCGLCIEFCPQKVIEANDGNGRPFVAHGERCTACHWCDTHCPDMAITVRRLEADELGELEEMRSVEAAGRSGGGTPQGGDAE